MSEEFRFPHQANQDTNWVADPANPVAYQTARLANKAICFVQPVILNPLSPKKRALPKDL